MRHNSSDDLHSNALGMPEKSSRSQLPDTKIHQLKISPKAETVIFVSSLLK